MHCWTPHLQNDRSDNEQTHASSSQRAGSEQFREPVPPGAARPEILDNAFFLELRAKRRPNMRRRLNFRGKQMCGGNNRGEIRD